MDESGQLFSAGALPRMMSREMPRHNGVIYHMAPSESEAFSPHYCGSVNGGSAFPGQSSAFPCSLPQTLGRVVMTSSHPVTLNSSLSSTIQSGSVGQKQLPDEVASVAQAVSSETSSTDTWSSSMTSHHPSSSTCLSADAVLSRAVTQQATETVTVNVACVQPVSSSSVQFTQPSCAPESADEKVLPCSEMNSVGELKQQVDRIDDTVAAGAVKVEPKMDMETESESGVYEPPVTSVKVEVKIEPSEPVKCEIKSEVASEDSVDNKDHQLVVHTDTDAAAVDELAGDAHPKKELSRKGMCLFFVFVCMYCIRWSQCLFCTI